jgi:hypothetical protein
MIECLQANGKLTPEALLEEFNISPVHELYGQSGMKCNLQFFKNSTRELEK